MAHYFDPKNQLTRDECETHGMQYQNRSRYLNSVLALKPAAMLSESMTQPSLRNPGPAGSLRSLQFSDKLESVIFVCLRTASFGCLRSASFRPLASAISIGRSR